MDTPIKPGDYHILLVEDQAAERRSLEQLLQSVGYRVTTADCAEKALSHIEEAVDFVITDLQLGDVSGMDLLRHWKSKVPDTMFLMVTGLGSTQTAVDAIKAGAYHYMTKPLDTNALLVMIQNMIHLRAESRKVSLLENRLNEKLNLNNIVGNTPQMQRIFELIRRSAQVFSNVLILGESGTGKELVAEAIHHSSPRRNGPFVAVNCAAMPATLVESELFGHEKGSFTGATDRRTGCFEAAHGGTLFIDEIGDFDISLQVKLLRVLESRSFSPVGGNNEIKVNTRVLAATSRDIRDLMAKGQFREDLYYRLNVIMIDLPPLRQRLDDIPLLVKRFMDRVNAQNGTKISAISPRVVDALQHYHWPGNVRELLNVVERMIVLTEGTSLELEDLPSFIRDPSTKEMPRTPLPPSPQPIPASVDRGTRENAPPAGKDHNAVTRAQLEPLINKMTLAEIEDIAIAAALERFHYSRTRAARALGISVRTLQRRISAQAPPDPAEGNGGHIPEDPVPLAHAV